MSVKTGSTTRARTRSNARAPGKPQDVLCHPSTLASWRWQAGLLQHVCPALHQAPVKSGTAHRATPLQLYRTVCTCLRCTMPAQPSKAPGREYLAPTRLVRKNNPASQHLTRLHTQMHPAEMHMPACPQYLPSRKPPTYTCLRPYSEDSSVTCTKQEHAALQKVPSAHMPAPRCAARHGTAQHSQSHAWFQPSSSCLCTALMHQCLLCQRSRLACAPGMLKLLSRRPGGS